MTDDKDLHSLVYDVKGREGEGWDGPSIKAWSDAVTAGQAAIKKARGQ